MSIKLSLNPKKKNEIVILSENRPGFGGFGTRAFKIYNYLKETYEVKLIYLNYDGINETYDDSNIIFINTMNKRFHYSYLNKYSKFDKKFHGLLINLLKSHLDKETIIITITPYTIKLIVTFFEEHEKIIYYCGSLKIENENLDNIYEISKENFRLHFDCDKYITKSKLLANGYLSKYYLQQFTENKIEIFYPYKFLSQIEEYNYDRTNDLIFIVNKISRSEKNFDLVYDIYKSLPNLKKIIIGQDSTKIKNLKNTKCYEFIENENINEYLNNSKICLIPSKFDVFPNLFVESLQNYCIPIISCNVGTAKLNDHLNYKYVCDFNIENWINTIENLKKSYPLDGKFFVDIYNELLKSNCNIHDFFNNI
jgi:hypothetical protein